MEIKYYRYIFLNRAIFFRFLFEQGVLTINRRTFVSKSMRCAVRSADAFALLVFAVVEIRHRTQKATAVSMCMGGLKVILLGMFHSNSLEMTNVGKLYMGGVEARPICAG